GAHVPRPDASDGRGARPCAGAGPAGKRTAAASRGRVVKALALLLIVSGFAYAEDDLRLPRVTRAIFDNGLHVIVAEYHELPLVELHPIVGAGAAQDPAGQAGGSAGA